MSRAFFVPQSSPGVASALRTASSFFLSHRLAAGLLAAASLLASTNNRANADWVAEGSHFGTRDETVFGSDGRGGMFGWVGYPGSDAQYFIGANGDTLPRWPVAGLALVPGNVPWQQHESFEPLSGVPDGSGGSYVLVAEQGSRSDWAGGFLDPQQLYVHRRSAGGSVAPGWDAQGVRLETAYLGHRFEWHHQSCMISDGRRGVIVAWLDEQQPYSRVLVQRVTSEGAVLWGGDGAYAQQSADACTLPTLVADGRGGALVFWGRRDTSGVLRVQGQHVFPSGALGWGPAGRVISTRRFDRMDQAIPADGGWAWAFYLPAVVAASDEAGGAMLAWAASEGADLNVYATRVAADGRLPWKHESVICSAAGDQTDLVNGPWRGGGAVVAWRDTRKGADIGFYAQLVTREGRTRWARDGAAVCEDVGQREMLRVRTDGEDGAYFAWLDFGRGYQLFAQRLSEAGAVSRGWGQKGTLISRTAQPWGLPWNQHYRMIDLAGGAEGDAMLGWTDSGSGTYAMRLTPRGPASMVHRPRREASPIELVSGSGEAGSAFALRGVSPNPVVGAAALRFSLPNGTPAALQMLDVAGRLVWSREVGDLGPGDHAVNILDGAQLPRGIYFVQLKQGPRLAVVRVAILR